MRPSHLQLSWSNNYPTFLFAFSDPKFLKPYNYINQYFGISEDPNWDDLPSRLHFSVPAKPLLLASTEAMPMIRTVNFVSPVMNVIYTKKNNFFEYL